MGCAERGADGPAGLQGPAVPILTHPASSTECPTGGTIVSVGDSSITVCNGTVGPIGIPGIPGVPGTDITPISIVPLCPGTTHYPSTFIEIAFCIANNLYAVYSANDGFLTYVPPGNYSSNAIGSSCNLTVHPNCVITH